MQIFLSFISLILFVFFAMLIVDGAVKESEKSAGSFKNAEKVAEKLDNAIKEGKDNKG